MLRFKEDWLVHYFPYFFVSDRAPWPRKGHIAGAKGPSYAQKLHLGSRGCLFSYGGLDHP